MATIAHGPLPGVNRRPGVERGATGAPARPPAALDRTDVTKGPAAPEATRVSLAPSMVQPSSEMARPATSDSTTPSGTNRAPFHRTLADAGGGHRLRGGATNSVSP